MRRFTDSGSANFRRRRRKTNSKTAQYRTPTINVAEKKIAREVKRIKNDHCVVGELKRR